MDKIEELRKKRFQYLHELYKETGGDKYCHVNMSDIGKALNFDPDEINKITQYLVGEYLMKHETLGGGISITHEGVREIENAISHPEQPSHYFPPVNIINIQNMSNSQIQQGAIQSSQTQSIKIEHQDIKKFIDQLHDKLSVLNLNGDDNAEIIADADTIQTQIRSSKPKKVILTECFSSIKRILEGVASSIVAQQLLQQIPAILASL